MRKSEENVNVDMEVKYVQLQTKVETIDTEQQRLTIHCNGLQFSATDDT